MLSLSFRILSRQLFWIALTQAASAFPSRIPASPSEPGSIRIGVNYVDQDRRFLFEHLGR